MKEKKKTTRETGRQLKEWASTNNSLLNFFHWKELPQSLFRFLLLPRKCFSGSGRESLTSGVLGGPLFSNESSWSTQALNRGALVLTSSKSSRCPKEVLKQKGEMHRNMHSFRSTSLNFGWEHSLFIEHSFVSLLNTSLVYWNALNEFTYYLKLGSFCYYFCRGVRSHLDARMGRFLAALWRPGTWLFVNLLLAWPRPIDFHPRHRVIKAE